MTSERQPGLGQGQRHRRDGAVVEVEQQRGAGRGAAARPSGPSRRSARPTTSVSARMHAATSARAQVVVERAAPEQRRAPRPPPRTPAPPSWTARRRAAPCCRPRTSSPGTSWPSSRSAHSTPAAYAAQPSTRPGPSASSVPAHGSRRWRAARSAPRRRRARGGRGVRRVGERDRQAQPAVVVGVLADQVDPPGRPADRARARRDRRAPGARRRLRPSESTTYVTRSSATCGSSTTRPRPRPDLRRRLHGAAALRGRQPLRRRPGHRRRHRRDRCRWWSPT